MAPNFELPPAAEVYAAAAKKPAEQPVPILPPHKRVPPGLEPPTDITRPLREGTVLGQRIGGPVIGRLVGYPGYSEL